MACFSQVELNQRDMNRDCDTGCRRSGYDAGRYVTSFCWCADKLPYESTTNKLLIIKLKPVVTSDTSRADLIKYIGGYKIEQADTD